MVKGTHSMGKKAKGYSHIICRRCGNTSYLKKKSICASCGFGRSKKLRSFNFFKK